MPQEQSARTRERFFNSKIKKMAIGILIYRGVGTMELNVIWESI